MSPLALLVILVCACGICWCAGWLCGKGDDR